MEGYVFHDSSITPRTNTLKQTGKLVNSWYVEMLTVKKRKNQVQENTRFTFAWVKLGARKCNLFFTVKKGFCFDINKPETPFDA